jgi:uncharacterized membrane protein YjjB (DUF3815 family)
VALSELAARHLVSATARLAAVGGTLLGMGLGVGLGQSIGSWVPELTQRPPWGAAGPWAVWTAVVSCAFAFTVLFRARPRDLAAILAATLLAFLGARAGTAWFGPELGGFVGALALGLVANTTARITRRPASTVLVPGLMVLVPGSLGFRSVAQFLSADALSGVETAFRMVIVAMALVGGLLAANLLLPPRRSL